MNFFKTVLFIILCAVYCMAGYSFESPIVRRLPKPDVKLTQGDVRVLVVLVEFADVRFKSADPVSQFTDYLNKEGYNEYHNIGSVRDYFIKNSMGKFRPTFDVYGPVTLPENREFYFDAFRGDDLALTQAIDSLSMRSKINFSLYDNSGDGVVEFTFMIFAGIATKNSIDGKTFWPHANTLGEIGVLLSGKKIENGPYIKRYACANEIEYEAYKKNKSTNTLSGVGVFIHEFSHLLGFPDYYSHNGNKTLDSWSVMDQGDHNCPSNIDYVRSCAPPLYSAFDRKFMEWLTPIEIMSSGTIRLDKLDDNIAYSITNPENRDEMYLLEYRSNKGWDVGQKNSGMLIWHIDYVDSIWTTMVNSKEWHMHVDIIEAKENNFDSSPSDVFPGSANVTEFNKFVFWNGLDMNITLSDITESPDKEYVTFNVTRGEPFMRELSSSSQLWIEPFFSSSSKTTLYYISYSKIVEDSIESIVVPKNSSQQIRVISQNGVVNIYTPLSGAKTVRMFSLNGQLLFETFMDGSELQFQWPKRLGKQKAVLSVTQGNVNLFMGVISGL